MDKLKALWKAVVDILDPAGDWVALLPIRLLMAYEFFKAGLTKFNGSNWFGNIQDLSLIHISEPTRLDLASRMPSSA